MFDGERLFSLMVMKKLECLNVNVWRWIYNYSKYKINLEYIKDLNIRGNVIIFLGKKDIRNFYVIGIWW